MVQARPAPARRWRVTVPTAITLARLAAVPATGWLILSGRTDLGFVLFVAAGLSDAVDGWLARVRDARSRLGALLDPLADKALLVTAYVTLAATGVLPAWLAALVVARDALILGGVAVLWWRGRPPAMRPLLVSKANTAAQILLAALALLVAGFGLDAAGWLGWGALLVAATTLASGTAYAQAAIGGRLPPDAP
jgi:cardiolipin synthase